MQGILPGAGRPRTGENIAEQIASVAAQGGRQVAGG